MNLTKIITTTLAIMLLVGCWGIRVAACADDVFSEAFTERDLSGSYDGEPDEIHDGASMGAALTYRRFLDPDFTCHYDLRKQHGVHLEGRI